ncbi:purple acid phosphatase family protein [Sulfurivermis fontis]|uniref:purple acid phosphatase family protein n=1 Tax=Sulfurivermis fontis TaxID=1972068 RepID=UPI000FDC2437|nr:metallophosphoesterase family protein [Sulfurivermis fontis]
MPVAFVHVFLRWLRRLLLGVLVLVALWGVGRLGQVAWQSAYDGAREPYLQVVSHDGITLRWQSGEEEIGVVRYGTDPARLEHVVRETTARLSHEVRLAGLQPATRYYYAVGTDAAVYRGGPDYWFHTAPPPGDRGPIRLWIQGDPGYWHEGTRTVRDAALQWSAQHPRSGRPPFDLWLTTGDNAYSSGKAREFQEALFEPYAALLRNIPYLPVYGNHDARRWTFYRVFSFPAAGEAGGVPSGSERYFSFDYANIHVVVLDSESGDLSADGPMLRWLQQDLAANRLPWTVALFHHPPYSRGGHNSDSWRDSWGRMVDMRTTFLPVLEAGGVDLVLSGHSHVYERSHLLACHYGRADTLRPEMVLDSGGGGPEAPYRKPAGRAAHGGTVYAVVGSTAKLDAGPLDHPVHAVNRRELGSLLIDVEDARLDAYFINAHGQVSDRFRIVKSADIAPVERRCGTGR